MSKKVKIVAIVGAILIVGAYLLTPVCASCKYRGYTSYCPLICISIPRGLQLFHDVTGWSPYEEQDIKMNIDQPELINTNE